jgi:hypothetical protein
VTVASLIAALFVATGAIVNRGGSPRSAPHHWNCSGGRCDLRGPG